MNRNTVAVRPGIAFTTDPKAARIDFIHGWEDTKKLVPEGAAVFFTPVIARERLFEDLRGRVCQVVEKYNVINRSVAIG